MTEPLRQGSRDLTWAVVLAAAVCCGLPWILGLGAAATFGGAAAGWWTLAGAGVVAVALFAGLRRRQATRNVSATTSIS